MRGDDLTTLRATTRLIALRGAYAHPTRERRDARRICGRTRRRRDSLRGSGLDAARRREAKRLIRGARAASVVAESRAPFAGMQELLLHAAIAAPTVTLDDRFTASPEARARAIIEELDDVEMRGNGDSPEGSI